MTATARKQDRPRKIKESRSCNAINITHKNHNINVSDIIERLKQALELDTDVSLAQYFGINPATIIGWKNRNRPNYDLIFSKIDSINFHWLITGKGPKVTNTICVDSSFEKIIAIMDDMCGYKLPPSKHAWIISYLCQSATKGPFDEEETRITAAKLIEIAQND